MTTRADVNELSAYGARAVELARAELGSFFLGLDLTKPELARDALLEFMPMVVQEYGDVAATAAAEWYEAQRFAQIGGSYQAVLADSVPVAQAQGSVRYAAGHLFGDDPAQTLALLSGALQRFVMAGSRSTVGVNAGRDKAKPRFARVPTGRKTCAWCELMASRGFVYHSKETAGIISDDYHNDCDCAVVSSWDAPNVDGYDTDGLYARYKQAWNAAGGRGAMSDEVAWHMRRLFPDQYTDGVFPSD